MDHFWRRKANCIWKVPYFWRTRIYDVVKLFTRPAYCDSFLWHTESKQDGCFRHAVAYRCFQEGDHCWAVWCGRKSLQRPLAQTWENWSSRWRTACARVGRFVSAEGSLPKSYSNHGEVQPNVRMAIVKWQEAVPCAVHAYVLPVRRRGWSCCNFSTSVPVYLVPLPSGSHQLVSANGSTVLPMVFWRMAKFMPTTTIPQFCEVPGPTKGRLLYHSRLPLFLHRSRSSLGIRSL